MSRKNVELVRRIFVSWESGDFRSVDWADPEIEFEFADGPTPGTWTGVAAMSAAWSEALSAFQNLDVTAERYVALEDDRVLVLTHNTGRGKASGFDLGAIQTRGANLFQLRDGKVSKLVLYWDRTPVLAAVGLSE